MKWVWLISLIVLVAACVAAVTGQASPYYVGLITEAIIVALFVVSLDFLVGFTGLESLGHAAFFGLGAYVAAFLSLAGFNNVFLMLAAALAAAALLGALFAVVALRATGPYFLILTLALANLPWALAIRWRSLTGGDDGLPGILRPELGFGISLDGRTQYLIFVACTFVGCTYLIARIGSSAFGRSLRGIKENPSRMAALGYRIWWHKFICFALSAGFAGISGALFAFYNGYVNPNDLSIYRSAEGLIAVILGGPGTLIGPALASIAILFLRFTVGTITQYWAFALGLIYICAVLLTPQGVLAILRNARTVHGE